MTISTSGVGTSSETYTLTFTSVSTNVSLSDVIVRVTAGSNTYSTGALVTSSGSNVTISGLSSLTGVSQAYAVTTGGGGYLTFDTTVTISITGTAPPALGTIALIYTTTGGDIAGPENVS
jgi:hypothetical protein